MTDVAVEQEEIVRLHALLARAADEITGLRTDKQALLDELEDLHIALARTRAELRSMGGR